MTKRLSVYQYGQSPAPRNWQEAADALKSLQARKPKPTLMDRVAAVEKTLKDRK